jgi:rod shape-determining protein MreD
MQTPSDRYWWLMPLSLLGAFLWQHWQLSPALRSVAPDAILLVTLHWIWRKPHAIGSGTLFLIGLFRDGIEGSALGQHALALVLTGYFVQVFHQRLRMFAIWQQSLTISLLACFYLLTCHWLHLLHYPANTRFGFFWSAATTGLCWPIFHLLLNALEQGFLRKHV